MSYRKTYLRKNGNFGNQLMNVGSYIPAIGLIFDAIINKKIEKNIKFNFNVDELNYEIQNFKNKIVFKDIYHLVTSATLAILLSNSLSSSDAQIIPKQLEGPNSLENVIKSLGLNETSENTFDYFSYLV
jgi:hypothetical protein